MLSAHIIILFLLLVVFICILLAQLYATTKETFGTSPGTLVQLEASHVPTEEDVREYEEEQRQVRHDLLDMTGTL